MRIKRIPFFLLFIPHVIITLYLFYFIGFKTEGITPFSAAGISFTTTLAFLYAYNESIIRKALILTSAIVIFFFVTYFLYNDFIYSNIQSFQTDNLLVRSINHISNLNGLILKNFIYKFRDLVSYRLWGVFVVGNISSFYLCKSLVPYLFKIDGPEVTDGSILSKRYNTKSNRFNRRF